MVEEEGSSKELMSECNENYIYLLMGKIFCEKKLTTHKRTSEEILNMLVQSNQGPKLN